MVIKKLPLQLLAITLVCSFSAPSLATSYSALVCIEKERISTLNLGWVNDGQQGGVDGGNVIMVKTSSGEKIPAHHAFNMNSYPGKGILSVLKDAATNRNKVTFIDNLSGNCKTFDEVIVHYKGGSCSQWDC
ncbi:hypothetical protein D0812_10525 [Vibrio owensii]|uniref:Uncharacterized protein n=1 Tax=Vibrio owensii TaxID=696485 RepID=A0AAP9GCF2_9VIBR|nr:hypothetical protein [Vibrio owensii]AYO14822.1 hypothetical protein D0812_10525 [Vibrio owensii]QGH47505.1 hypothetical protein APZ19_10540 [Vibrio owensii]